MNILADLRLSDNQLTGEFPVEILDLKNMRKSNRVLSHANL